MSVEYKKILQNLRKNLPFLKEIAIIDENNGILFYSNKWNITNDLPNIIESWSLGEIRIITILSIPYIIRTSTSNRLIGTAKYHSHIVGVKKEKKIIFAQIEIDGIIPFTTLELSKLIDCLWFRENYEDNKYISKKNKNQDLLSFSTEKSKFRKRDFNRKKRKEEIDVSFTARLMAYYRGIERYREKPLIIDPLSELLAGDFKEYLEKHVRYSKMDYPIVRSYFIEKKFLTQWCERWKDAQIVILGAGLDTRAYRFKPLKQNNHTIYEIDLSEIIEYKEKILRKYTPLCNLKRISADLSKRNWNYKLKNAGYSNKLPTFWILEGLVYYIELEKVKELFKIIFNLSKLESQIFVDLMQRSRWFKSNQSLYQNTTDPFTKHFKWGMNIKSIPGFFSDLGFNVECSFADDHDQGRDVGQKAMIFIYGKIES